MEHVKKPLVAVWCGMVMHCCYHGISVNTGVLWWCTAVTMVSQSEHMCTMVMHCCYPGISQWTCVPLWCTAVTMVSHSEHRGVMVMHCCYHGVHCCNSLSQYNNAVDLDFSYIAFNSWNQGSSHLLTEGSEEFWKIRMVCGEKYQACPMSVWKIVHWADELTIFWGNCSNLWVSVCL